jgi:hypothetical protein
MAPGVRADLLTNPAKHGCRHAERKSATPAGMPRRGPGAFAGPLIAVFVKVDPCSLRRMPERI